MNAIRGRSRRCTNKNSNGSKTIRTRRHGKGHGGRCGGASKTGNLSDKLRSSARAEETNEWKVNLRAENRFMDTIPSGKIELQKENHSDAERSGRRQVSTLRVRRRGLERFTGAPRRAARAAVGRKVALRSR